MSFVTISELEYCKMPALLFIGKFLADKGTMNQRAKYKGSEPRVLRMILMSVIRNKGSTLHKDIAQGSNTCEIHVLMSFVTVI